MSSKNKQLLKHLKITEEDIYGDKINPKLDYRKLFFQALIFLNPKLNSAEIQAIYQ